MNGSYDQTFDVGHVHVLTETGGPCATSCPHPDHDTNAPDVSLLLDLLADERPKPPPDNADPHPVTLRIDPRETKTLDDGTTAEYEAYFSVEIAHPETCSGHVEECPVAEYVDVIGPAEDFLKPFGEPDHLTDEQLAALDGTVRHVVVTRSLSHHSGPYGEDWDVDYDFTWLPDDPSSIPDVAPEESAP